MTMGTFECFFENGRKDVPNKHIKIEPTTIEEEYKTYTTKSVLRLVPSRNYNNQKFICKVSHPTLPDGHKKYSLNISVQCKCHELVGD